MARGTVPARVSLVTLAARDLPALRRFYQALGWPETSAGSDEFTAFQTGGAVLALYGADALTGESGGADNGPSGFALALNVETKEQVDDVMAAMVAAGAFLATPAADQHWGGRSGYVADPEGNRWEVAWNPHTSFDERGGLIFP
jgi:uncharacterized glyoxalase superfamily protein PhnB